MKVFKITFFFLLSTVLFASCNTEIEQPITKMSNADREFLEKLNQSFTTEIVIGMPKRTIDSILLSCGFQYYTQKNIESIYAFNAPSSLFPFWPELSHLSISRLESILFDAGIYTTDKDSIDSIFDKQYIDSVYKKGRIYVTAQPEYDETKCLSKINFIAKIHPQLEETRYVAKMFSNSLYQKLCDTIDNSFSWEARTFYRHADYNYDINQPDKIYQPQQRDSYLEFIADKECFSLYERINQSNSKERTECSYSFRFYNYEESRWGDAFYKSVAGFGITYEGY